MTGAVGCQVCGGAEQRPFARQGGHEVVQCTACGFVFLDPMPAPEDLATIYDDAYDGATTGYFAKVDKKMRRSRRRFGDLAKRLPAGAPRRFLDVGASAGFMVEAAREAGFEAWGVELDPASVAYAREHYGANNFVQGRIEDLELPEGGFGAIYCSEVIEHVGAVNGFVAAIARALAPEGVLYLTTPDIGHWRRPRDLDTWDAFCPPSHCLYFTPATLTRLLGNHGLRVLARRPAFKPGIKLFAAHGQRDR
jgi:SAM-dependent methyltransferase